MSFTAMPQDFSGKRKIRFAWALPLGALLLSALILWPVGIFFLWDLGIHLPAWLGQIMRMGIGSSPGDVHSFTSMVAAFNLPVGIIQLPFAIFSASHQEPHPAGVTPMVWNALTWPLLCVPFWWISGRAIDALGSLKNGQITPRIGWVQTIVGSLLMAMGVTGFIAILIGFLFFSTHDDKKDIATFMRLAAGCGLWAMLGGLSVAARFRQWRLQKNMLSPAI
jgi:hypothetical protein